MKLYTVKAILKDQSKIEIEILAEDQVDLGVKIYQYLEGKAIDFVVISFEEVSR